MQRTSISTGPSAAHIHVRVTRFEPFHVVPQREIVAGASVSAKRGPLSISNSRRITLRLGKGISWRIC